MTTPTVQYRLNLPHALLPISPALSALHTSRAVALHPDVASVLHPSHCPKCGTYRFSGDHLIYPSTTKKRKRASSSRPKSIQRNCHLCGLSLDDATCTDSSSTPTTNEADQGSPSAGTPPQTVPTPAPPFPVRQSHPKSSHTKASTLKDMLSRDRQREEGRKKGKEGPSHQGLAAFLKQL